MDCRLPGSSVHGNFQARVLEWVAISFSNAWKWKVKVKSLSRVQLSATPWTAAYQAPPSMGISRQEYWSGVPLLSLIYIYIYTHTHIYVCVTESHTKKNSTFWNSVMFISEKAMAPHSSTLAWKFPWMEEHGRLQSMGSQRVGHDWATSLSFP